MYLNSWDRYTQLESILDQLPTLPTFLFFSLFFPLKEMSNLCFISLPFSYQPQAHHGLSRPSRAKSDHHVGAAAGVVPGANRESGEASGRVGR